LLAELRAFIDCIETRKPPLADGQAGYESVRVIEAALESVRTRKTITL
jgi:predicted dehydrogenase